MKRKSRKLTERDKQRLREIYDALDRVSQTPLKTAGDEMEPWLNKGDIYLEMSDADYDLIEAFLWGSWVIKTKKFELPDAGSVEFEYDGNVNGRGAIGDGKRWYKIIRDDDPVDLRNLLKMAKNFGLYLEEGAP